MSEIGTPAVPSHCASESTALSNTGWASSPATRTACHRHAAGSAPSACQEPSHRHAITAPQRGRRGSIDRSITGWVIAVAQYGIVAAAASNPAHHWRLTWTPVAPEESSGQAHWRALSTLFIMICQSLLARNLYRTRHGARR